MSDLNKYNLPYIRYCIHGKSRGLAKKHGIAIFAVQNFAVLGLTLEAKNLLNEIVGLLKLVDI